MWPYFFSPLKKDLKFVVIGDTHGRHRYIKLPPGDVLLHTGDITYRGKKSEVEDFLQWFSQQAFAHKIFIAGNHDFYFERATGDDIRSIIPEGITYLNDSGITIGDVPIWGSPVTPKFFNWAFNRTRGEAIRRHWQRIPAGTKILITHGPPFGILDQLVNDEHVGCKDLLQTVQAIRPEVHLFGHIHESYGTTKHFGIRFINASLMNENYDLVNKPILFVL